MMNRYWARGPRSSSRPSWLGRGFCLVLLSAIVLTISACGGGSSASSDEIAQGLVQYRKTCATCHGQNAEGMPRLGKPLHKNAFVASKTDDELVQFLKEGRPATHPDNERGVDMPPKGGNPALTDNDLRLIVLYLRTIQ